MDIKEFASMGGKARAAKLSKERLSEIGLNAIKVRWKLRETSPKEEVDSHVDIVRRCQSSHCLKAGKEVMVHGLKAWLCQEHS